MVSSEIGNKKPAFGSNEWCKLFLKTLGHRLKEAVPSGSNAAVEKLSERLIDIEQNSGMMASDVLTAPGVGLSDNIVMPSESSMNGVMQKLVHFSKNTDHLSMPTSPGTSEDDALWKEALTTPERVAQNSSECQDETAANIALLKRLLETEGANRNYLHTMNLDACRSVKTILEYLSSEKSPAHEKAVPRTRIRDVRTVVFTESEKSCRVDDHLVDDGNAVMPSTVEMPSFTEKLRRLNDTRKVVIVYSGDGDGHIQNESRDSVRKMSTHDKDPSVGILSAPLVCETSLPCETNSSFTRSNVNSLISGKEMPSAISTANNNNAIGTSSSITSTDLGKNSVSTSKIVNSTSTTLAASTKSCKPVLPTTITSKMTLTPLANPKIMQSATKNAYSNTCKTGLELKSSASVSGAVQNEAKKPKPSLPMTTTLKAIKNISLSTSLMSKKCQSSLSSVTMTGSVSATATYTTSQSSSCLRNVTLPVLERDRKSQPSMPLNIKCRTSSSPLPTFCMSASTSPTALMNMSTAPKTLLKVTPAVSRMFSPKTVTSIKSTASSASDASLNVASCVASPFSTCTSSIPATDMSSLSTMTAMMSKSSTDTDLRVTSSTVQTFSSTSMSSTICSSSTVIYAASMSKMSSASDSLLKVTPSTDRTAPAIAELRKSTFTKRQVTVASPLSSSSTKEEYRLRLSSSTASSLTVPQSEPCQYVSDKTAAEDVDWREAPRQAIDQYQRWRGSEVNQSYDGRSGSMGERFVNEHNLADVGDNCSLTTKYPDVKDEFCEFGNSVKDEYFESTYRKDDYPKAGYKEDYPRGGYRNDSALRNRGGYRNEDYPKGGYRSEDYPKGDYRSEDYPEGGYRSEDYRRGGYRSEDYPKGSYPVAGCLDYKRDEYTESGYRNDSYRGAGCKRDRYKKSEYKKDDYPHASYRNDECLVADKHPEASFRRGEYLEDRSYNRDSGARRDVYSEVGYSNEDYLQPSYRQDDRWMPEYHEPGYRRDERQMPDYPENDTVSRSKPVARRQTQIPQRRVSLGFFSKFSLIIKLLSVLALKRAKIVYTVEV